MIERIESNLNFYYETLEGEKALYEKYTGVIKHISGVRINLLIGTVDITEAALRTYKNQKYEFGVKLSSRAMILHIHEVIDSGFAFEDRLNQLSKIIEFDANEYLIKIKDFGQKYRKNGLKDIRGLNKIRDIYGHSDPDWSKVIRLVDEIDVREINKLTALTLNYREILVRWSSDLRNFWVSKFKNAMSIIDAYEAGVKPMSDEDIEKCRTVISYIKNELDFTKISVK